MIKTLTNQVIALAGLIQATFLVKQIAQRGTADADDMETAIRSVFRIDAEDVPQVYGGVDRLKTGLKLLERQLVGPVPADADLARYMAILVFLERKLVRQPEMMEKIRAAVMRAAQQAESSGEIDDGVFALLAEVYQQTVSRLRPRVLVQGEPGHLTDVANANRIRALLLAGIRSVVLWRQCGGARWKLLFQRPALHREARRLLATLRT
ncbi:MAG TPA: high frequency lysogenization protein HflD [Methylococcus sp.]|nr:high frequency lysogenization protein HflD [Methylococcus sp.]